jgi:hypothetical protein
MYRLNTLLAASTCLLFSQNTLADSRIDNLINTIDRVKLSGYVNITAGVASEENGAFFDYSDSLDTTTETWGGLQFDFKATDKLDMTVLTKFFAENKPFDESFGVDLAYISYKLSRKTKIRAGILRVPLYKDSDFKDTGFAHLWLRTPELIYQNNKVQRHTGLDILHNIYLGDGTLQLQAFFGQNEDPRAKASCQCSKDFFIDDLFGVHGTYSIDEHVLKVGVTTRTEPGQLEDFLLTNDSGEVTRLHPNGYYAGQRQTFYSFGYMYDDGLWRIDAESIIEILEATRPDSGRHYVSVGYRFGTITPYISYQIRDTIDDDKRGRGVDTYELPNGSVNFFNTSKSIEQTLASIGFRYDINEKLAFKAQFDQYDHTFIQVNGREIERDNSLYSLSLQAIF